ncbi:MAG: PQQ-binding-like beta-propeller repeat protein [Planctomycetota bacterium]
MESRRTQKLATFVLGCVAVTAIGAVEIDTAHAQNGSSAWPQWGGPNRDFKVPSVKIADKWPADGPKKVWTRELGDGYSGIVARDGVLYTMYRKGDDEVVVALDADTGKTRWEYSYAAPSLKGQTVAHGKGPNSTPLLAGKQLVTVGFAAKMHGLDANTGKVLWSHDLIKEFGAKSLEYGYSASPMSYKDGILVAVGGSQMGMACMNPATGAVVWKSEPFDVSYASPILVNVLGEDQCIIVGATQAIAISAADGKPRLRFTNENQAKVSAFTPLWGTDNRLYVGSHTDGGSRMFKLSRDGDKTQAEELWFARKTGFIHSSAVWMDDHIYGAAGVQPPTFMVAVDVKTGETKWKERGFPKANCLYVDGKLILLDEDGQLALATATPEKFTVHSKVQLLKNPARTAPTLVGPRLYVRDRKSIMALDLS